MDAPQSPSVALRVLRIGEEYIELANRHRERSRLYNDLYDEFNELNRRFGNLENELEVQRTEGANKSGQIAELEHRVAQLTESLAVYVILIIFDL